MAGLDSGRMGLDFRPFICGGVAAMTAEVITFPMDTAKTRLQLQGKEVKYTGAVHTLSCIVKEEGLASVYRGLAPALLRQAVYGTIKFGLYYSTKEYMYDMECLKGRGESNFVNLFCAVFAGSVSSAIANPTDVVKVRMQAKGNSDSTRLVSVFINAWKKEGVRGLWRGVWPTTQRSALVAGVQLPVYDWTKSQILRRRLMTDGTGLHLTCSLTAGIAACTVSNPCDVVRTRLMVQRRFKGAQNAEIFRSAFECCSHSVRKEGFLSLYKGFIPAFARMGPWNIIFFLVYENINGIVVA